MSKKKSEESDILLNTIIQGMQDMKADNITVLDFEDIDTSVCKYFVICSGSSNTHVSAISENIKKFVRRNSKEKPWGSEGYEACEWVLLDYLNIVVHIFQDRIREFYGLEDLWADARIENIKKI
tara:strand:- start:333 stop:704 length:372 start_codon:yes stop_codon:yes gene_type:complete